MQNIMSKLPVRPITIHAFLNGLCGFEVIFVYLLWLQKFFTTKESNKKRAPKPENISGNGYHNCLLKQASESNKAGFTQAER